MICPECGSPARKEEYCYWRRGIGWEWVVLFRCVAKCSTRGRGFVTDRVDTCCGAVVEVERRRLRRPAPVFGGSPA